MNLKIQHKNFEINLVDTSFTMVEENNWFSDKIFSKFTYPIKHTLTDEEDAALAFISNIDALIPQTIFDVVFVVMENEHEAVMEIERIVGSTIEFQVRYGFEEFPNFEKKLAQIPMHKFDLVGETIFEHALSKINHSYPETDYNFPRIFTDAFDKESPQWEFFKGSINNYNGTIFLPNEYNAEDNLQINRNVMQPLPSLLYVLRAGFADKGYELKGDILEDPHFKEAWLWSRSKYYSTIKDADKQEILLNCDDFISGPHTLVDYYKYFSPLAITESGRYKIAGNLFLSPSLPNFIGFAAAEFRLNGERIAFWSVQGPTEVFKLVDVNFDVLPSQGGAMLEVRLECANYRIIGDTYVYDAPLLDVTVSQLTKFAPDGTAEPTLVFPNEIDLSRCVPDLTFGDLYKVIKLWKNYGAEIIGKTVYLNKTINQIGSGLVKDLTEKEVIEPERTYNQGKTFELKFSDVPSDIYDFQSLFITSKSVTSMPYVLKEDTEEITIEAIPLPRKEEIGIVTAHSFLDDDQKVQLVLYDGLQANLNTTKDNAPLLIPAIYEENYKQWIDFLLKTVGFAWLFNDYDINIRDIHSKTTIFAYGKHHTISRLQKKNMGKGIIQTEIETYSIE